MFHLPEKVKNANNQFLLAVAIGSILGRKWPAAGRIGQVVAIHRVII